MRNFHKTVRLYILLLLASTAFIAGCDKHPASTAVSEGTATMADSIITTKIKSGILADPLVKGLDPQVETRNGNVQFNGTGGNQAQLERVTEIARSVSGVKSVENKMSIDKKTANSPK